MGTFSATANSSSTIGYAQYGSSSWSTGSSSGACQGAYQGTTAAKSRVGVMVFSGAGAALKAICLDRDSQELKYEIFSRLNLGAIRLKDQEVRNCIFRGSFNAMLRHIADTDENVKALFHYADNKRMEFEERILRYFAMRDFYHVSGTFKNTMNQFMSKHQNDSMN